MLHDPAVPPRTQLTREQYADKAAQQTTLNHFHEKLFKLKASEARLLCEGASGLECKIEGV